MASDGRAGMGGGEAALAAAATRVQRMCRAHGRARAIRDARRAVCGAAEPKLSKALGIKFV